MPKKARRKSVKSEEIQITDITIEKTDEIIRKQLPKIKKEVQRIEASKRLSGKALDFRFNI
jgi:hypothetical protein